MSGAVFGPILIAIVEKGPSNAQRGLLVCAGLYSLLSMLFLYKNGIDISAFSGQMVYAAKLVIDIVVFIFILSVRSPAALYSKLKRACYSFCTVWTIVSSSLIILETGVRTMPVVSTLDINPGIRYFWPDWVNYPLNKFGHRDREFLIPKESKVYRILLLGDSFTEGAGLSREQTFGRKLQAQLNNYLAGSASVEVYNLGHCGWNTQEEVALLEKQGDQLEPNLVILGYVFNDSETHPLVVPYYVEPNWGKRLSELFLHRHGSYAYYLIQSTIELFPKNFRDIHSFYESQHAEDQIGWVNVKKSIERYKQWLNERNIEGIAVIWPMFTSSWKNNITADRLHTQVADAFTNLNVPIIDLRNTPDFIASDYRKLAISSYDSHPNEVANQIVSRILFDAVLSIKSFKQFEKKSRQDEK